MKLKLSKFIFIFLSFHGLLFSQIPKPYLEELTRGLTRPIDIKHCGDDRLFVVEQRGLILIMDKKGILNPVPFLNIDSIVHSAGNEQGLLGLTFSPNYKKDGFFFVNFVTDTGKGTTIIARYSVNPLDSNQALPESKLVLLEIPQPGTTHNGGNLMFGKDGYLYISMGDGGGGNFSQDNTSFHSKILRIDPFKNSPYAIPRDNPFLHTPNAKAEIWAAGLRNPWRCSFDRLTGDLWIADVGQDLYEEINFQPAASKGGENYGWRCYEGSFPYNLSGCSSKETYHFPAFEYPHGTTIGCSVTGGYVYRGTQYQNLFGRYLFTDACTGKLWSTQNENNLTFKTDSIGNFPKYNFITFGEDNEGELYAGSFTLMQANTGRIWKLRDSSSCQPVAFFSFEDTLMSTAQTLTLQALVGKNLHYQWIYNGVDIPNENTPSLVATKEGNYSVLVSNTNCSSLSKIRYVKLSVATNVNDHFIPFSFTLQPNPIHDVMLISAHSLHGTTSQPFFIRILDVMGTVICSRTFMNGEKIELYTNNFLSGIYFVEMEHNNAKLIKKLIKH